MFDSNDTTIPFGKGSGFVVYQPTGEKVRFPPDRCLHSPRETVLDEHNPSCDLRSYTGGLVTCHQYAPRASNSRLPKSSRMIR